MKIFRYTVVPCITFSVALRGTRKKRVDPWMFLNGVLAGIADYPDQLG